jgi:aspartate aminotransferase
MLAERMNTFSGSPTSALIAKVAELRAEGKDIISLNVGEPDFGTPDYIKCGAIKAIVDNFSKYTAGNGIIELRRLISKKLHEDNNLEYTTDEICATVGAKQAIFNSIMALVDPGDEVLLPVPCWVSYRFLILKSSLFVFYLTDSSNKVFCNQKGSHKNCLLGSNHLLKLKLLQPLLQQ